MFIINKMIIDTNLNENNLDKLIDSQIIANDNKTNSNKGKFTNYLTQDQLNVLKESFDLFDVNRCNSIDLFELKLTLKAFNFKLSKEKFSQLIQKYAKDNFIIYENFIKLMTQLFNERDPREEASIAFDCFDVNKKGKLGLTELKLAIRELDTKISETDLQHIIDEFDKDGDGYIKKDDFLAILDEYYFN